MERLTECDEFGNADIIGVDSEDLQLNLDFEQMNKVTDALNKLAQYEGLEEQGLLLRVPCKVGDTLYCDGKYFAQHCKGEIHSFKVTDIVTEVRNYFKGELDYSFDFSEIGKTVFLTQSEAKQKLKEMESD